MLGSNPFSHIVGNDFPCAAEPPKLDSECPCIGGKLGGPQLTEAGYFYCPACFSTVGLESGDDLELFDEEDDEESSFAAGEVFIAEGDRIQDRTGEEGLMVIRVDKIHALASELEIPDNSTAVFMIMNDFLIAQTLRNLELSNEPLFKINTALSPKILSITSFLNKKPISDNILRKLKVNPTAVHACIRSLRIISPGLEEAPPMIEAIRYVGNALDLPKPIVDIIVEQYVDNPLYNREPEIITRAAAFVYIRLRQANLPITKSKLKNIPGVGKNAVDRAIDSYRSQMRNGNNRVEAQE
jgi:hypothetical protein